MSDERMNVLNKQIQDDKANLRAKLGARIEADNARLRALNAELVGRLGLLSLAATALASDVHDAYARAKREAG